MIMICQLDKHMLPHIKKILEILFNKSDYTIIKMGNSGIYQIHSNKSLVQSVCLSYTKVLDTGYKFIKNIDIDSIASYTTNANIKFKPALDILGNEISDMVGVYIKVNT